MRRIGYQIRDVYNRPHEDELAGHLERGYGIRATATRLGAGTVRIDHPAGPPWVARLFIKDRPLERARDDAACLAFLEQVGFPAERIAHAVPVTELGEQAVLVTLFESGTRPANTPATRRKLGSTIGKLATLPLDSGAPLRRAGSLHHLASFEGSPSQDIAAARGLLEDLAGRVPPAYRHVHDVLLELIPRADGGEGLPEALIHPDPVRSNALATADGLRLIDWTGAGRGPRAASLAALLDAMGPRNAPDVIAGYQGYVTLTDEELDRLEGMLWIRPLWMACWNLWLSSVSKTVNRASIPEAERIRAIATSVRDACR